MNNAVALPAQPQQPASQGSAVEQTRAAAEVAAAVAVARNFPRSQVAAVDAMRELCGRLTVAEKAFYEVPNRGSGMSVHIARELALIWGNIDHGVRELARDDRTGESEMSVWAWDQEQNVRSTRSFIQPHAKSTRQGRKELTDLNDIYLNNQNTGARAVREAIFTVLPGWFVADAQIALQNTLNNGGGIPIEQRRAAALEKLGELKIDQKRIEAKLGKPLAQWASSDLATLSRIYSSITIDGIKADEFFPEIAVQVPAKVIDEASPDFVAQVQS